VGQTLTAVVLTLDAAETLLWAEDRAPSAMARSAIQRAQELAAIALDETRDVAHQLRPDRFVETGLVAAAHRLAASAGAPVTVTADPGLAVPGLLAPEDEMNVYRIIQEAVTNAVRHARAKHISIAFTTDGAVMSVAIVDDGIGFDARTSEERGLGFAGMQERARILRGRLEITSGRREGARVLLTVPLLRRDAPPVPSATVPVVEGGAP
jgi:two-component system sensor histidine kinase UhpB